MHFNTNGAAMVRIKEILNDINGSTDLVSIAQHLNLLEEEIDFTYTEDRHFESGTNYSVFVDNIMERIDNPLLEAAESVTHLVGRIST